MKMMLEMKQIGIFFLFLAVQVIVKMFPLYGKEETKNCRKTMSNNKLREVCENDKLKKKKRKERQQKKLITLNQKRRKDGEQKQPCRQKSKSNKEQELEESLIKKKGKWKS